jgi:hypothetical protein
LYAKKLSENYGELEFEKKAIFVVSLEVISTCSLLEREETFKKKGDI